MKRPFAVFCAILAALSVVRYAAGHPDRDGPLREAAALLQEEAESGGGEITLAGTVAKCSAVSSGVRLSVYHLTIQRKDHSEQSLLPDLNVTMTTENTNLLPGDEIMASGKAVFREPATNPGQFDAQSYYYAGNSICMLSDARIRETRPGRMSLARALYIVRRGLGRSLEAILEAQEAHTMEAICLGERELLTQEWKEFYQEGGIAHILAISGLHISLVGMCLYRLLRRLGASFGICCVVSGTVVLLYVLMSGAGISAVRALIMFGFWLGAQLWGRKYDMLTAAAAAAMLLLVDAGNLSQSSFLLSFAAVLTIALLVPCLQKSFREAIEASGKSAGARKNGSGYARRARKAADGMLGALSGTFARSLVDVLLPGLAIWLGTLPVMLYFFYQAVPWSILINLAVVPLMTALMAFGLAAGIIGLFCVPAGVFCAAPVHYLLGLFELLCRLKEELPLSVWVAGRPAVWRIALYYGILLAAGMVSHRLSGAGAKRERPRNAARHVARLRLPDRGKCGESGNGQFCDFVCGERILHRIYATLRRQSVCMHLAGRPRRPERRNRGFGRMAALFALWLFSSFLCVSLMSAPDSDKLEIICLDVGQGDAALLRLPGGVSCLVDGGSTSESKTWKYRIGQAVKYYGVRTLDYIFLSHADEDHVNGIEEYLQEYVPGFGGENIHGVTLRNLVLPPTSDSEDFAKLRSLAREKGIRILQMEAGGRIGSGPVKDISEAGNASMREVPDAGTGLAQAEPDVGESSAQEDTGARMSSENTYAAGTQAAREEIGRETEGWSITCLAPDADTLTGDRNEDSMVLLLRYGEFRMLFTGDLEGTAEQRLTDSEDTLSADVLKVGHHGSKNASSEEFLAQVSPQFAVISCGENNSYGHPAPETVERLQDAGSRILQTPQSGAVMIESDGETYSVETYITGK